MIASVLALLAGWRSLPWKWIGWGALILGIFLLGRGIWHSGYKSADDSWRTRFAAMQHRAELAEQARDIAIAQIGVRARLRQAQIALASQRGHDAIQAATPAHEEPIDAALVSAWRVSIDGLCVFPGPSGSLPDTCGSQSQG